MFFLIFLFLLSCSHDYSTDWLLWGSRDKAEKTSVGVGVRRYNTRGISKCSAAVREEYPNATKVMCAEIYFCQVNTFE